MPKIKYYRGNASLIKNNIISNGGRDGIVTSGSNLLIQNNKILNQGYAGMSISGDNITIGSNTVLNSENNPGISLSGRNGNSKVINNIISNGVRDGIVISSPNTTITNNTIKHNSNGLNILSKWNVIEYNIVCNNNIDLYCWNSQKDNKFLGNTFKKSEYCQTDSDPRAC